MFDLSWKQIMDLMDDANKASDAAMKRFGRMDYDDPECEQAKKEMYIALGVCKGLLMAYDAGVVKAVENEERL